MTVNGTSHTDDVEPRTLLVYYLREHLGLTGTNVGCDTSSCGACTVHVDGESVKSARCSPARPTAARHHDRGDGRDGEMHPLQDAFHRTTACSAATARPA